MSQADDQARYSRPFALVVRPELMGGERDLTGRITTVAAEYQPRGSIPTMAVGQGQRSDASRDGERSFR